MIKLKAKKTTQNIDKRSASFWIGQNWLKALKHLSVFPHFFLIFIFVLFLLSYPLAASTDNYHPLSSSQSLSGKLSISGAWALYPLVARWAEEFQKENPSVIIDLQAGGAGKGIADALAGLVDIGMVSRTVYPEELSKGALPVAVARDAVVATLNQKNPFLKIILEKGLTSKTLRAIWIEGRIKYWEEIYGLKGKTPIHLYTRSDACGAAETWAAFLGAHQEDLKGIAIYGDPGLAEAVRHDPLGIGFNNLNFAYNPRTGKPHSDLVICPLDLNQNGKIDPEENFYLTRDQLISAISSGLYPSPPARDLYLVVKRPVENSLLRAFLSWIFERGQKLIEESGYVALDKKIIEGEKQKLLLNQKSK